MVTQEMNTAFIFDMDGVLTDNMELHALSWMALFRDRGLEGLDPQRYLVEAAGMKGHDVLRRFLDPDIGREEAEHLTELKDFLYRVNSRELIKPVPGLRAFLEGAGKAGIGLGVGTGAGPRNTDYVLDLLKVKRLFRAIVDSSQVEAGKPAPDIFLKAAGLLGVAPSRCLVFEDALQGVEAAVNAGMACVALTTTNSRETFGRYPNVIAVIDHFADLDPLHLLERLDAYSAAIS